jgi:hypothetical protein|tara:strand:- start:865 stop:1980 length:1116 start_codon:yes stop_codon:yes gene_type:complete
MLNKRISYPGYAVTEILLAVVIISIAFIEISRAYANISNTATSAISMSLSSNLAHATMERVMAQDFDAKGNENGDYALVFDGNGDYVDVGNAATGVQSISFWIEVDDITSHTDYAIDLNGTDYIKIVDGEVTVNNISSPVYYVNSISGERTIGSIDAWYHVAVTTTTGINASDVDIGRVEGIGYFDGRIDQVRIWNDVRTATEIKTNYNRSLSNPYGDGNIVLCLMMNSGSGNIVYDHSSSMDHGSIVNAVWTSQFRSWSSTLSREGETVWSNYNDVDDFNGISFKDSDYTGLDASSNNFSGLGGRITVKYVSLNTGTNPYSFDNSASSTDFKQVTVKVGIPGTSDSTQLDAIKSAKADQGYALTFSPYGS